MSLEQVLEHESIVNALVARLRRSGRYDWIEKHIEYNKGHLHGEADVLAGRGTTINYYEVKSHCNDSSQYKALRQFKRYRKCSTVKDVNFIYVSPERVKRIKL